MTLGEIKLRASELGTSIIVSHHNSKPRAPNSKALFCIPSRGITIAVARALAVAPDFVILDEPTSFLDVSVQAQILNLLSDLQEELNLTYLFISHNLSVIEHMSDRVGVMYVGKIMETAEKHIIYQRPEHPYTHALISALPIPNPALRRQRVVLSGDIPSPVNVPSGCRFRTRCSYATDYCKEKEPPLSARQPGHLVSCHYELKMSTPIPITKTSCKI